MDKQTAGNCWQLAHPRAEHEFIVLDLQILTNHFQYLVDSMKNSSMLWLDHTRGSKGPCRISTPAVIGILMSCLSLPEAHAT